MHCEKSDGRQASWGARVSSVRLVLLNLPMQRPNQMNAIHTNCPYITHKINQALTPCENIWSLFFLVGETVSQWIDVMGARLDGGNDKIAVTLSQSKIHMRKLHTLQPPSQRTSNSIKGSIGLSRSFVETMVVPWPFALVGYGGFLCSFRQSLCDPAPARSAYAPEVRGVNCSRHFPRL